jgi:hypothetical protein
MRGDETGSEQEAPLPHRHERPCQDAQGVGVGGAVALVVPASAVRAAPGRDAARAARSASRFGYPGDGNG